MKTLLYNTRFYNMSLTVVINIVIAITIFEYYG